MFVEALSSFCQRMAAGAARDQLHLQPLFELRDRLGHRRLPPLRWKTSRAAQANSAGVIDFGEMMTAPAPSGRFQKAWATTRSLRLPHDPVAPERIAPNVLILADTDDPVAWGAAWLARGKAD